MNHPYLRCLPKISALTRKNSHDFLLHVSPQKVPGKFSGLKEDSRTLHHTPTQHLSIHYLKINAPFSQNFNLNHKINTQTPAFWRGIKLTENVIIVSLPRPRSEKTLF
jgi:hypothetical protein